MAEGDNLPAELPKEPPKYADIVLTPEQEREAREQYPDVSEKQAIHRKKLSVLATLKHQYVDPTTGRAVFGGPQPNSGRKATKRIGEALVEAAQGRHKEIVDAAFAPISQGNDPMERHKAAMNIVKHEREQAKLDMAEDEFARKSEDEVRGDAVNLFVKMVMNGDLSLADIAAAANKNSAEGSAEEMTDADVVA